MSLSLLSFLLAALCLLNLLQPSEAAGVLREVSPNNRFVTGGRIQIDTSPYYNKAGISPWTALIYNVTYPTQISSMSGASLLLALDGITMTPLNNEMEFQGKLDIILLSYFTIVLKSSMPSQIQLLRYRVLIFTDQYSAYNNNLNVLIMTAELGLNQSISSSTLPAYKYSFPSALNGTQFGLSTSLVGFHVNSTASNIYDFGV